MTDIQELDSSFLRDTRIQPYEEDSQGVESAEEEDDISEEDEELQEEQGFEGPSTWHEVSTVELDSVMLRVTSAAMPSSDNKEVGTRLAMQAAALEADNSDPLGLGRIDPRQLTLVRADEAKKVWRTGRILNSTRRQTAGRRQAGEQESPATAAAGFRRQPLVNAGSLQELRPKALPTSENFDPEVYLGAFHQATTLAQLLKGRQNLKNEVSERTGQLKALVKENFDRFISCKNTIDDIHKRLRKSEAHDSLAASGNSTADMVVAISEVQDEAKRAFANLLERAATSDQVKSVVALLKRYEGLFQLPSRIRQGTERAEFDQVISEYRKARSLMDSMGAPSTKSVWHKLFTEVEVGVAAMVKRLEAMLRDPATPQVPALDAMRHLLQLQAERAACTAGMEPVMLYIRARERDLRDQLEACTDEHRTHLQSLRQREPDSAAPRKPAALDPAQEANGGQAAVSPWQRQQQAAAWLAYAKQLVHIVATALPDFWHVPQDKLTQIKAVPGTAKVVQEGIETGLQIAQDILTLFANKVHSALRELVQEDQDRSFFLASLQEIISGFVSFRATNTPPFVSSCLQGLLETASRLVVSQMVARQKRMTARMAQVEDFEIIASSHKAGHPASKVPGMLRDLVAGGMAQLEAVVEEASRVDEDAVAARPLGSTAGHLRHTFYDCFSSFAIATDQLWAAISGQAAAASKPAMSADVKLLVLHSNCVHMRTHVLKDLTARYGNLLSMDGGSRENRELLAECVEGIRAVEARLASVYIEGRVALLNDMLEDYFEDDGTDWLRAPPPAGLRDCAFELINALVAVQAELYGNALSLQRRVMDELLQHILAAYNACLIDKLADIGAGGALQLLAELQYFSQALGPALRPPRDQLLDQAKARLLRRIDQLAEVEGSAAEAELERWCETIQGGDMGGRADMVTNFMVADLIKATRLNIASFKV